jgi:hypothetical protein
VKRLALASLPTEILSTLPVAVAALLRRRQGYAPLAPESELTTVDDLLRMSMARALPRQWPRRSHLFRYAHRQRAQHGGLDRPSDRVKPRFPGLDRARRLLRFHQAAAWRRAGSDP